MSAKIVLKPWQSFHLHPLRKIDSEKIVKSEGFIRSDSFSSHELISFSPSSIILSTSFTTPYSPPYMSPSSSLVAPTSALLSAISLFSSRFSLLFSLVPFLDASSHLYKRVCPSVGPSVRRSVRNAFVKSGEMKYLQPKKYGETHLMFDLRSRISMTGYVRRSVCPSK